MNAKPLVLIATLLAAPLLLASDREPVNNDPGPPYKFTIVDLVYRVENIGGTVTDLEIKETQTEVRVDMAADVRDADRMSPVFVAIRQVIEKVARGSQPRFFELLGAVRSGSRQRTYGRVDCDRHRRIVARGEK